MSLYLFLCIWFSSSEKKDRLINHPFIIINQAIFWHTSINILDHNICHTRTGISKNNQPMISTHAFIQYDKWNIHHLWLHTFFLHDCNYPWFAQSVIDSTWACNIGNWTIGRYAANVVVSNAILYFSMAVVITICNSSDFYPKLIVHMFLKEWTRLIFTPATRLE